MLLSESSVRAPALYLASAAATPALFLSCEFITLSFFPQTHLLRLLFACCCSERLS